jgi:hypothetical protein
MYSDGSDPHLSRLHLRPLGRVALSAPSRAESRLSGGRVSPFGDLRIKARLPAPRSFSQAATSFIACNRLGIHHMHLVA